MYPMAKIEHHLDQLIEVHGLRSIHVVREMKNEHGTRCLPMLISLLGDGDWTVSSLFETFRLTSLVRATFEVRKQNLVTDDRFLKKLEDECFWKLNRKQLFRVADELLYLFPERFDHLNRWMRDGGV